MSVLQKNRRIAFWVPILCSLGFAAAPSLDLAFYSATFLCVAALLISTFALVAGLPKASTKAYFGVSACMVMLAGYSMVVQDILQSQF